MTQATRWIGVALVLAYPLLSHAAVWWREPLLEWLALLLIVLIPLLAPLIQGRAWAWLLLPLLGAGLYLLTAAGGGVYALYLPSLLFPALVGWAFGSSLLPGRTPLITRMALAVRGSMGPDLTRYMRRQTQLWTGLFAVMVLTSLLLIALGQRELWSLQSNFLNYLACGAMFVGDHLYRQWRFPELWHPGFIEYLRIVARSRPTRT